VQGDYLFYLDPHVVRPAFRKKSSPEEYTAEEIETCHTMRLRRLHVRDVDPSMMFAFLIRDEKDWETWRRGVMEVQGRAVVTVGDKEPNNADGGVVREEAVAEVISEDEDDEEGELVG
jgi:cysteine protease ATG4